MWPYSYDFVGQNNLFEEIDARFEFDSDWLLLPGSCSTNTVLIFK